MESFRLLFLGDIFGNGGPNDANNGEPSAAEATTVSLQPFLDAADSIVLNLETPLTGETSHVGTWLKVLGVDAVNLANGHAFDRSPDKLESTFLSLSALGIDWFGAGNTAVAANAPYRISLPERVGGGEIRLQGSLQFSPRLKRATGVYAEENSAGVAPLQVSSAPQARHTSTPEASFHVALPHWGVEGDWRNQKQFSLAHRLLKKDYDLILGNGSRNFQEVHRKQGRWVIYGIGNGVRCATQDFEKQGDVNKVLPFGMWAMFEVHQQDARRWVTLKLYPVAFKDSGGKNGLYPVSSQDFDRVVETLASLPARPWRFDNAANSTGTDNRGNFLALDLGEWKPSQRPSRLKSPTGAKDPGDWPLRSPSPHLDDKVLRVGKHLGATLLAIGAEADGGTAHWLTYDTALIRARGKSLIAYRYNAHESALGAATISDKVLTSKLLEEAGVPTPRTVLAKSANEAVQAARAWGRPVVVKPRGGVQSKGVSTNVVGDDEVRAAFGFARANGGQVIVQPHIDMVEELRVMATPDGAVAVNGRLLPHVLGDGSSTIQQLIDDKNLQRALNPSLYGRPIPVDALTLRHLSRQGASLDSVPEFGERIIVRNVAGLSVGGDTNQLLAAADPAIKEVAASAIAAIPGLAWGGVDVIVEKDTGKPYVLEINSRAAYGAALFPAYGEPRDVVSEAWQLRYANTAAEPVSIAEYSSLSSQPISIIPKLLKSNQHTFSFQLLLFDSLQRQGYGISRKSSQIRRVSKPKGRDIWITRNGLTSVDREAVRSVLFRHRLVSKFLSFNRVPRTRRRVVTSTSQFEKFTGKRQMPTILMPLHGSWVGPTSHLATLKDVTPKLARAGTMLAQSSPEGPRFRVLASQERSWVVTVGPDQLTLIPEEVASASNVAIQAVRAVPELRWAAVDVVMLKRREDSTSTSSFVEGMTIQPTYTTQDQIIAGSFDDFCRWLVEVPIEPTGSSIGGT